MRAVLVFLQPELTGVKVEIFGDNEGATTIAGYPSSASKSRHIDVKLHFIRGLIYAGEVRVSCTWERRSNMPTCSRNPCGEIGLCCTAQL